MAERLGKTFPVFLITVVCQFFAKEIRHSNRMYIQYIQHSCMFMKSFWIYILAFFPFQVSGMLSASTIQPGFLADQHAKTINSNALDTEGFLKLKGTCGRSSSCVIGINGESIVTSSGIRINSDRIIGWTLTNATNRGGALFVGKNEDYKSKSVSKLLQPVRLFCVSVCDSCVHSRRCVALYSIKIHRTSRKQSI